MDMSQEWRVRRALTGPEYIAVLAVIVRAESPQALVAETIRTVYDTLLADVDRCLADFATGEPLDPTRLAIPEDQWGSLLTALVCRAELWGAAVEVALEYVNRMPSTYTGGGR